MIEARIYKDPARGFGSSIILTKTENGQRYFAQMPYEFNWQMVSECEQMFPLVTVNKVSVENEPSLFQGKLEQIEKDKKEHIENLNEILKMVLNK